MVGGSADIVSGAFEHTINMQVKGQRLRAFVLQGRAPQIVLGINPKTMPNFKSVAELKGKKLGVTAPGSSTNVLANFVLAKVGLKPGDVSIIGVGTGSGAVAAMRTGQIDAISNLDPVITLLTRRGDLKIVSDTRIVAEADKVFGGPMPAGCLYTPADLPRQEPGDGAGAGQRAGARRQVDPGRGRRATSSRRCPRTTCSATAPSTSTPSSPPRARSRPTACSPRPAPETARRALASIDPEIAAAKIDLAAIYTNDFVKRANAKYPKG